MGGRSRSVVALAAFALLALGTGQASASTSTSCVPPGFETLVVNSTVGVYAPRYAYSTRTVFGCVEASGHRKRLGPVVPSRAHDVQIPIIEEPYALTGHWFAAYEVEGYAIDEIRYVFFSKNVAGHGARRCVFGLGSANGGEEGGPGTSGLYLAADGNFAWVEFGELHVCLPSGPEALPGTGVKVSSVNLEGHRLTWTGLDGEHAFRL